MSTKVDMELKKAFSELQQKMVDTARKLQESDVQIESLKRSKQHAEITEREISTLSDGTKTYDSVGRMFVLTDLPVIKDNLQKRQSNATTRIATLETSKQYLSKSIKEAQDNMREMVALKRDST